MSPVRYVKPTGDTVWPVVAQAPAGITCLEWRLRYARRYLSKEDAFGAASVVHAYEALVSGFRSDEEAAEALIRLRREARK